MTYSIAEGIALGGIAGLINLQYPGIVFQALIGTVGVFVGMLVVYKTGAVKVTPRFTQWLMGALIGVVVLMLANLVAELLHSRAASACATAARWRSSSASW